MARRAKTAASEGKVGGVVVAGKQAATPAKRGGVSKARVAQAIVRAAAHGVRHLDGPPRRAFETEVISDPPPALRGRAGIPRDKNGIPKTEGNPDLAPYKARGFGEDPGIYDDMLRTDGTAAGTVALMVRSISTAPADIWTPPNPTPAEAEGAALARRFLGLDGQAAWLRGGLPRHVRQACRAIPYGFQAFEKVWRPHMWRGRPILAPSGIYQRASRSVKGWAWDGDDLRGMVQEVAEDADAERAGVYGLRYSDFGFKNTKKIIIPSSQLLLYTYDPSGEVEGAPEGLSILRPGWVWWKTKRDLILRYHMAADRLFGGVTLLQQLLDKDDVPMGSEEDLDSWDDAYAAWADGELGWLGAPTGWKVEQSYPEFDINSPDAFLRYCDDQMRVVFAAQLLGGGTAAQSEVSAQMLYNSVDQIASWIAEVINGQPDVETGGLIRDLIDYNIPHDETFRYPRLFFKAIEHRNFKSYIDSLMKLYQFFGLTYTVETEQYLRGLGDAPLLTPAQAEKRRAFEDTRLTVIGGSQASQGGTQAPTTPPQQQPVDDPDGEDDAG